MATAVLIATGVAVCAAVQLLVRRYWFALSSKYRGDNDGLGSR